MGRFDGAFRQRIDKGVQFFACWHAHILVPSAQMQWRFGAVRECDCHAVAILTTRTTRRIVYRAIIPNNCLERDGLGSKLRLTDDEN